MMLRALAALTTLGLLAACTPPEVEYCRGFGVEGTPEYGKCISYYNQQEQVFGADRASCALEADRTYPPSLYDTGGFARVYSGAGYWGGPYYGSHVVSVPPDYARNAEVDRLRLRIIGPCMQAKGWNSAVTWQAGRSSMKAAPKTKAAKSSGSALPWLK